MDQNNIFHGTDEKVKLSLNPSDHILSKAISLTTKSLYSNKIEAIIRELACNAYDSHVRAGYPQIPFTVILPSTYHPFFQVLDYGIGMDDQDIKKYFSLLESDKTNDNTTTGSLGLGAKSPFCYSEVYFIDTIKNGIRRLYVAEDNGIPTLALQLEEPRDKQNQTLITVPTLIQQHNEWKTQFKKVLKYFSTLPYVIVDNNVETVVEDECILQLKKSKTEIVKRNGYYDPEVILIQANVGYKYELETSYFKDILVYSQYQLHIHFDNGELEFVPSREKLSYDSKTILNIKKKIELINEDLKDEFLKEIEQYKSNYDKMLYVRFIKPSYFQKCAKEYVTEQKQITQYAFSEIIPIQSTENVSIEYLENGARVNKKKRKVQLQKDQRFSYDVLLRDVLFVMDSKKIIKNRITHYLKNNYTEPTRAVCFYGDPLKEFTEQLEHINNIIYTLENPKVISYSTLPKVKKIKKPKDPNAIKILKVKKPKNVPMMDTFTKWPSQTWHNRLEFNIDKINSENETIYYVSERDSSQYVCLYIANYMMSEFKFKGKIIKVNDKIYETIKDNNKFQNFIEIAKLQTEKNLEKYQKTDIQNKKSEYFVNLRYCLKEFQEFKSLIKNSNSLFLKLLDEYLVAKIAIDNYMSLRRSLSLPLMIDNSIDAVKNTEFQQQFYEKYPLLDMINFNRSDEGKKTFVKELMEYINYKDSQ